MSDEQFIIMADGEEYRQTTATAAGDRVRRLLVDGADDITIRRGFV